MKLTFGSRPRVAIDLEPGCYILPCDSAIGKSYLCSLLKKVSDRERVNSHSFPDKFHPEDILDSSRFDIVMLDRYDMRDKDYVDEMREFVRKGALLLDCKSMVFPLPCKMSEIWMSKNELIVG